VDEAVVAEVEPDVREREAARIEEHEVAGRQSPSVTLSPRRLISRDVRGRVTP
jgi:hypothetical protein